MDSEVDVSSGAAQIVITKCIKEKKIGVLPLASPITFCLCFRLDQIQWQYQGTTKE